MSEQTTTSTAAPRTAPADRRSAVSEVLSWPGTRALIAVLALFAVSPLIAIGSVSPTAIVSMLPFAALIAIVAVGQTLVIQQGGLDLSIPGAVTLGALIAAKFGTEWDLATAIVVAIVGTSVFGLLSGIVIAYFGLPPLVVTIASNALMIGAVQAISGGFSEQSAKALSDFALSRLWGIPVLAFFAVGIVIIVHIVLKLTRLGRRFELVGENPRSAANIGISTRGYVISSYWLATMLGATTGVLLAGLLRLPTLTAGNDYLLPSIAAVVLGGTALTGGKGSVIGTALGALFLAQLGQLVQTFTQATAVQNIVQALIIGVGIVAQLQLGGSSARLKGLMRRSAVPTPNTSDSMRSEK
ncbi:ABC transporter permease [Salinibacterium soli]|uniref:ABC transporter permease n=1 Tax=Antiquaquibacter soli TaxID=3064523 RepID=A0ABT9BQR7_9MICO|nr:ABC transporter permease [Protaetiibacter sp. WY-16]MDO7883381.1 ABC transporter permease [Protaetiibacter sp. WY-16]